jgi:hypothetical protein
MKDMTERITGKVITPNKQRSPSMKINPTSHSFLEPDESDKAI